MLLTIIIPIAVGDNSWKNLLSDLSNMSDLLSDSEVLLAGNDKHPVDESSHGLHVKSVKTANGRAQAMNQASTHARGEYLWFIHADTRITETAVKSLLVTISQGCSSLLYFDLLFTGKKKMWINSQGVSFRSRLLQCPYGDQAFCIRRNIFICSQGYPEDADYGEDHLWVWKLRSMNISLLPVGHSISTSARKYEQFGWIKVTNILWVLEIKG